MQGDATWNPTKVAARRWLEDVCRGRSPVSILLCWETCRVDLHETIQQRRALVSGIVP